MKATVINVANLTGIIVAANVMSTQLSPVQYSWKVSTLQLDIVQIWCILNWVDWNGHPQGSWIWTEQELQHGSWHHIDSSLPACIKQVISNDCYYSIMYEWWEDAIYVHFQNPIPCFCSVSILDAFCLISYVHQTVMLCSINQLSDFENHTEVPSHYDYLIHTW